MDQESQHNDDDDVDNESKNEEINVKIIKKSDSEQDDNQYELEEFGLQHNDEDIDAGMEDEEDTDIELTDDQEVELGDIITAGNKGQQTKHNCVESDSELPENITLLPSKADTEQFGDLYDPQMIVQKKRMRCTNCIVL